MYCFRSLQRQCFKYYVCPGMPLALWKLVRYWYKLSLLSPMKNNFILLNFLIIKQQLDVFEVLRLELKIFQFIWRPKANSVSLPLGLVMSFMVNLNFDIYYEDHAKKIKIKNQKQVSNLNL